MIRYGVETVAFFDIHNDIYVRSEMPVRNHIRIEETCFVDAVHDGR